MIEANPAATEFLIKGFTDLAERFKNNAERYESLSVVLRSWSQDDNPAASLPFSVTEGKEAVRYSPGPKIDSLMLPVSKGDPINNEISFNDTSGIEVVSSDKKPFVHFRERYRQATFYLPAHFSMESKESLSEWEDAAKQAGKLLSNIPTEVGAIVWQEWPNECRGLDECDKEALWTSGVFELAWQNYTGSPLTAKRVTWHKNLLIPLDKISLFRGERIPKAPAVDELLEYVGNPCSHWCSKIRNIWRASEAAAELLVHLLKKCEKKNIGTAGGTASAETSSTPTENKSPPYSVDERLGQIQIGCQSYKVSSETVRMASLLLEKQGEWVSMSGNNFTKPSDIRKKLPKALQDLIETSQGKGYRLRP